MFNKNKGILLVEALLSILILGVAITASVRSISYAVKAHDITKKYYIALQLLENKMSELESNPELKEGTYEGIFEKPNNSFSWSIRIDPLKESNDLEKKESQSNFFKIHTTVFLEKATNQRYVSAETILFKNTNEDNLDEDKEENRLNIH